MRNIITSKNFIRTLVLRLLRRFNFDFRIYHHWHTGSKLLLNSFKHKGYWFYGKSREKNSMELISKCVGQNDYCIEVGGHIGYLTMHFSKLVGSGGKVIVFEPSPVNLYYLKSNLHDIPQVEIVEQAVSDTVGEFPFYIEELTGQNNSLVANYDQLAVNINNSGLKLDKDEDMSIINVAEVTLDDYLLPVNLLRINFLKIDIEGNEYPAIIGAEKILRKYRPIIMIEVTENALKVETFLKEIGYKYILDDQLNSVNAENPNSFNWFCFYNSQDIPQK